MKRYGLLGFPLTHSFSKSFFTDKFQREGISGCRYDNFSIEHMDEAAHTLKSMEGLEGFNVTIPHKVNVMSYLDGMSEICAAIKSCNCVRILNGRWIGHNTDVIGFSRSLTPLLKPHHKNALVFGTGGASLAVRYVLEQAGIAYQLVSRNPSAGQLSYQDLSEADIASHPLLINTTPLGMFPHVDGCVPIPYSGITSGHLAYDLIYNPAETTFLKRAKEQGATTENGRDMLIIQAEESWKIWQE